MVLVDTSTFTNALTAEVTTVFKANAGDRINCKHNLVSTIEIISYLSQGGFVYDYTQKRVYTGTINPILEGFVIGDAIEYAVFQPNGQIKPDSNGNPNNYTGTITDIGTDFIELSVLNGNIANTDTFRLFTSTRRRDYLEVFINQVDSSTSRSINSHIDSEPTRYAVSGLNTLLENATLNLTSVSNESGQFQVYEVKVKRLPDPENVNVGVQLPRKYEVTYKVVQSGVYQSDLFDLSRQVELSTGFKLFGYQQDQSTVILEFYQGGSDTGWFNQNYNQGVTFGQSVVTPISDLYYDSFVPADNTFQAVVDTNGETVHGYGACFIPNDDTYYKNTVASQTDSGMLRYTDSALPIVGENNEFITIPAYTLDLTPTLVTNTLTLDGDFTVNGGFKDLIESFGDGNRRFIVWAKIGSVNLTLFDGQLEAKPVPDAAITPDFISLQNFESDIQESTGATIVQPHVEDAVNYLVQIPLDSGDTYNSVTMRVYASDGVNEFDLQSDSFDLTGFPLVNGNYNFDLSTALNYNLASESKLNEFRVFTEIGGTKDYLLKVSYPFLINWRYWKPLLTGVDPIFFDPTINNKALSIGSQDWLRYYDTQPNWEIFARIGLETGVNTLYVDQALTLKDYDSDPNVTSSIEIIRKSTGQVIQNLLSNEICTIKVTYTRNAASWDGGVKGDITIRSLENDPRYQISTSITDTKVSNPLKYISKSVGGSIFTMTAEFDPTKIATVRPLTISTRVNDSVNGITDREKMDVTVVKLPEFFDGEDRGICVSTMREVRAGIEGSASWKNDITTAVYKKANASEVVQIQLFDANGDLATLQPTVGIFDTLGVYGRVDWQEVLILDGAGKYTMKLTTTVSGIPLTRTLGNYNLMLYTTRNTEGQVRIRTTFDRYAEDLDLNFAGMSEIIVDDVRIKGTFGRMQPKQMIKNLTYSTRQQKVVTKENVKTYELQSRLIFPRLIQYLVDFTFLHGTRYLLSDYNAFSADDLKDIPVIIPSEGDGLKLDYFGRNKERIFKVTFEDEKLNKKNTFK